MNPTDTPTVKPANKYRGEPRPPASRIDFLSPLHAVPKLGPKRRGALLACGIRTVGELLYYFPSRYVDRSAKTGIKDAGGFGDCPVTVSGAVERVRVDYFGKPKVRVIIRDGTGALEAVWYFRAMSVAAGDTLVLTGKVTVDKHGKLMMFHPVFEKITDDGAARPVLAVYSVKEAMREAGISQRMIRGWIEWALDNVEKYPMVLPQNVEYRHSFPSLKDCLREVHLPGNLNELDIYKARLKYEELYNLALNLRWNRRKFALPGRPMTAGELEAKLRAVLPFELTESQERAVKILYADAAGASRMHRLLQGDVGSGKTVTALMATLPALNSGRQAAWMAPTEVLAKQTKNVVEKYLQPLGIRVGYLGAGDAREMARVRKELADGGLRFVVGTHALFMPSVKFHDLGMAVIDEQHKFGAEQRLKLQEKGPACDFLLMSATPIPQTLAKTLYGDLDIVEITSRPGRKRIATHIVPNGKREGMERFILELITAGSRAFYVVPRIDQQCDDGGDDDDDECGSSPKKKPYDNCGTPPPAGNRPGRPSSKNNPAGGGEPAVKTVDYAADKLKAGTFAGVPVHRLHGQMSFDERDGIIDAFRNGPPGVLVATTIVEVGVDIPDAAVMVIENPEYFGLAQLHQIRGRVGRSDKESFCFLLPGVNQNEDTIERLKFLCGCDDGFKIAEWDLRRRGPGDTAGARQSGWDNLKMADILNDAELFMDIMRETEGLFVK